MSRSSITTPKPVRAGLPLSLAASAFGQLLASELVAVQPMSLPSGLLFFLDFKYDRSKSGGTEGGSVYGNL
ncbi:MAG: hypothetical protein MK006_17895, partial [Pirellulales bacterium]|nr:hypothetical protein [Pirellulales bacterium]